MSGGLPKRSTQTRAAFTSSRRFAPVTASSGLPKALPRRVFTSTNVTRSPCRPIRSISVCPTRNRCATILHPRDKRYRMACSSPAIPRRWRSSVHCDGSVLMPLLTDANYRSVGGRRNRNYAGGALSTRKSERGTEKVSVSAPSDLPLLFRVPRSAFALPRSVSRTNLIQLFQSHQHVPRLGPVGGPEDAGQLQLIDDPGGATVPDAHAPLQQRGRAELVLDAHFRGLPEQRIALAGSAFLTPPASVFSRFFRLFQCRHLFIDARARSRRLCGMRLVPVHEAFGFVGRDEGPLHAEQLALAGRQKQHVPVPEHGLGAVLVEDGTAVDLGRDPKRDAAREVRLDEPGDDVHRRTLGGEHQVNADRPSLLRECGERRFDLALHREHQVRELVDDEHDVGEDPTRVFAVERQLLLDAGLCGQRLARTLERFLLLDLLVEVHDVAGVVGVQQPIAPVHLPDRKSTRLNSSHLVISYAVFCLKKKNTQP